MTWQSWWAWRFARRMVSSALSLRSISVASDPRSTRQRQARSSRPLVLWTNLAMPAFLLQLLRRWCTLPFILMSMTLKASFSRATREQSGLSGPMVTNLAPGSDSVADRSASVSGRAREVYQISPFWSQLCSTLAIALPPLSCSTLSRPIWQLKPWLEHPSIKYFHTKTTTWSLSTGRTVANIRLPSLLNFPCSPFKFLV